MQSYCRDWHVSGISKAEITGVGIGCPGSINSTNGTCDYSNNLGWANLALCEKITSKTHLKSQVANDANCAVLGEVLFGAGKGYRNLVMLTLGTGVGSGLYLNGQLYEGNEGKGAELGHTLLVMDGRNCTCGRKGCLEAYCSASALIADTKEAMVVLVMTTSDFPHREEFVKDLLGKCPEITTLVLNVNKSTGSKILGDEMETLYGPGYIQDELCGLHFRISAKSFYQTNPVMTEILYKTAMDFAELTPNDVVFDAYSGIGTIGLIAAKHVSKVISVEIVPEAVEDAKKNAAQNGITNFEVHAFPGPGSSSPISP